MDTPGKASAPGDTGTVFMSLAYGETTCGQSAGWEHEQASAFFDGVQKGFSAWPRRARGLSVQVRRHIRAAGLHGIQTQTAMGALCSTTEHHLEPGGSTDWVIAGFESDAWRNFPRGFLSMAHRRRVEHTSRLTNDVSVRPGPFGPMIAGLDIVDSGERLGWTLRTLGSIYGDDLTTLIGLALSELCFRTINGDQISFEQACTTALEVVDVDESARVRFRGLLDDEGNRHLVFHRQVLQAMRSAAAPSARPVEVLYDVLRQGGASDTAGAAAGAILGARFGLGWFDTASLVSHDRLSAYQSALQNAQGSPESLEDFLVEEADLTRREMAFRDEMIAERRTGRRDGSVA